MAVHPRPTVPERPQLASLEPAPPAEPLARPAPAAIAQGVSLADADSPLPLDGATIALSLPIAIALGQLNVPAAAGWAAILILYKAITAPGVARGTLDALVDGLNVEGDVRARLGVPPRAPRQEHRRPSSPWGAPAAAVGSWRAAVSRRAAATGQRAGEGSRAPEPRVEEPPDERPSQAHTGTTTRLPNLASVLDGPPEPLSSPAAGREATIAEALARLPAVLPIRELAVDPRPLAVPLGVAPSGEARWVDLGEDVVNVGVYGTTGAGKDLLLFQWFVLLCRRNQPDAIQFIVLDGKGDWLLPQLAGLAHMQVDPAGGYGNVQAIKGALDIIHQEARNRERLIFGGGHRSREHYIASTGKPLPLLVVIVTDLMTTVQGFVEEELAELISKARALGIRVVMSFQNPTGKDMSWRSNIGLVLAGCMVDGSQDAVVLGIRRIQDMRYRPSQLPNPRKSDPATKGLFVVRHGTEQLLVKAPYLDDDALLALCARLPRRPGAAEEPAQVTVTTQTPVAEEPSPAPDDDPLLAALLRQAPVTDEQVLAARRRRWPRLMTRERYGGRRRGGTGWQQTRVGRIATEKTSTPPTPPGGSGAGASPPPVPASGIPSEDDRLYRMMRVPLTFNQIYRAIGTDRNVLSRRCQHIRQERGLGPWPRSRAKLDREQLVQRMAAVPMGFNEIYRALGGGRTDLSQLYQKVTGRQAELDSLETVSSSVL